MAQFRGHRQHDLRFLVACTNEQGLLFAFLCVCVFVGLRSGLLVKIFPFTFFIWRKGIRMNASWQKWRSLLTCVRCL